MPGTGDSTDISIAKVRQMRKPSTGGSAATSPHIRADVAERLFSFPRWSPPLRHGVCRPPLEAAGLIYRSPIFIASSSRRKSTSS